MRRLVPLLLAVVFLLGLAADAGAKMLLKEAEACGASGCATQMPRISHTAKLPFRLLGPTIEAGRVSGPPPSTEGPRYRVTLTTLSAPGDETISLDYYPDVGYIEVLGEPRSEAGGALLNTGWVRLTGAELRTYGDLTAGLTPYDAEASHDAGGGGPPWAIIGPLAGVAALGGLLLLLLHRRGGRQASPWAPSDLVEANRESGCSIPSEYARIRGAVRISGPRIGRIHLVGGTRRHGRGLGGRLGEPSRARRHCG